MAEATVPLAGFTVELKIGGSVCGSAGDFSLKCGRRAKIDTTRRSSNGHKEFLPGIKNWSVAAKGVFVSDDAGEIALRTAKTNKTSVAVAITDDDDYGFSGSAVVAKLGEGQPMDGGVSWDTELKGTGALAKVTPA